MVANFNSTVFGGAGAGAGAGAGVGAGVAHEVNTNEASNMQMTPKINQFPFLILTSNIVITII
ncbi:hypothetical protein ACFLXL_00750 [Chloroflexota bacterium]